MSVRSPLFIRSASVGALALLLGACNVMGPSYRRPPLPLSADVASTLVLPVAGFTLGSAEPWVRWWSVFHDAELERLVDVARRSNQDLRAALSRVAAARALARQAGAERTPEGSANSSATGQQSSGQAVSIPGGTSPKLIWTGTGDVSYEMDLFGKLARGAEAACAEALAAEEDRRSVEITLIADVAQTYFDVGAAGEEATIARDSATLLEKTLALVQARLDAGLVGELDLRRTEGDLASSRALIPEADRKRAVAEHRLAVLLGNAPGASFEGKAPSSFEAPPEVPVGLPATLVERRPDIRAAERRLIAANARVGEAIADFYPSVTLSGRFGYSSSNLSTIGLSSARLWSIGPSIHIPIFEGGRLAAAKFEKEADKDAATATYVQTVLNALAEVADAVVGVSSRLLVRDRQKEAVAAALRAVELANVQYEKGLTGYVNVLDAQRTLAAARLALLAAQRQVLAELILLGKSLGGGWSE